MCWRLWAHDNKWLGQDSAALLRAIYLHPLATEDGTETKGEAAAAAADRGKPQFKANRLTFVARSSHHWLVDNLSNARRRCIMQKAAELTEEKQTTHLIRLLQVTDEIWISKSTAQHWAGISSNIMHDGVRLKGVRPSVRRLRAQNTILGFVVDMHEQVVPCFATARAALIVLEAS